MRRKGTLTPQDIVALYTIQHLTGEEIGRIDGVTRQTIYHILRQTGIDTRQGERVQTHCDTCGKPIEIIRKRWRTTTKHYCSTDCDYTARENPNYRPWRQGQRIARIIISQHMRLEEENVIHHEDGDSHNNNLANLKVFTNQSEHMKYHHGGKATPIWDGSQI